MKIINTLQLVLIASILSLVSCNSQKTIPMKEYHKVEDSELTEKEFTVIEDEGQLKTVYNRIMGQKDIPNINWNQQQVVLLTLGQKYTGGYGIDISEVIKTNKEIKVLYKIKNPKAGDIVTQALTAPYVMTSIDKPKKLHVVFEEITE